MSHPYYIMKQIIESIIDTIHEINNRLDKQDKNIKELTRIIQDNNKNE